MMLCNYLQTDLTAAGVLWQINIKPETLSLKADSAQIQQVLINLIKNASESFTSQTSRMISINALNYGWRYDHRSRRQRRWH